MIRWWCSGQIAVPWTWTPQPYLGVWLFMAALAVGYALVMRAEARTADVHGEGARPDRSRVLAFVAAWLLLWGTMDWPIGALAAGYLLVASMVQVVVITYIVAPLLVHAVPPLVRARWLERPAMSLVRTVVTRPALAFALMNAILIVTHLPGIADALHASQFGTMAMDLGWIAGAVLFWWALDAYRPASREARFGVQVAYLLASNIVPTLLGILLVFDVFPLYRTYEFANRVFIGFSAAEDQQAAGLLMWVGTAPLFFVRFGMAFHEAFSGPPPSPSSPDAGHST
jgi:cytochrome c oxidase assembly factor CtaG